MTNGSTHQAAKNVTLVFVRRCNAVHEHDRRGTKMVGNNAHRLLFVGIRLPGKLLEFCDDAHEELGFVHVHLLLQRDGRAFKAHARVDASCGKR